MGHPLVSGEPWYENDTVSRRIRFCQLAAAGYAVPRHGLLADMKRLNAPLVMYTDAFAHCGEGKYLILPGYKHYDRQPHLFASEYLGEIGKKPSVSLRTLWVGDYKAVIEYRSEVSWMSNVDGEYNVLSVRHAPEERARDLLRHPMYAIDFVRRVAVDLNVCPGLPREVVNAVGREELVRSYKEFVR